MFMVDDSAGDKVDLRRRFQDEPRGAGQSFDRLEQVRTPPGLACRAKPSRKAMCDATCGHHKKDFAGSDWAGSGSEMANICHPVARRSG